MTPVSCSYGKTFAEKSENAGFCYISYLGILRELLIAIVSIVSQFHFDYAYGMSPTNIVKVFSFLFAAFV